MSQVETAAGKSLKLVGTSEGDVFLRGNYSCVKYSGYTTVLFNPLMFHT